jgi:broad specificity phosphatase PhoE
MQLYFCRHGQSLGNLTNDYRTPAHDQLSPLGWQQAERLAERLAVWSETCGFDAIYASPLHRAMETITPYLRQAGRKAEIWPELVEGCWQADRRATPPARSVPPRPFALDASLRDHFEACASPAFWAPENEVYTECLTRISQVAERLLDRHAGRPDSVLVVGHEYAGGRLIEMLLGVEPQGRLYHANTGLTWLVEGEDGSFVARFLNRV